MSAERRTQHATPRTGGSGMRWNISSSSLLVVGILLAAGGGTPRADEDGRGAVRLRTTIPVPGHLVAFDISWVDPDSQLYYLADRSNNAIDVIDARRDVFVKQIDKGGFVGFTGNNDTSGPNGIVTAGRWMFVSDGNSRVISIDLRSDMVVDSVSTGGAPGLRADEMAFDPRDGILLAANNADSPPFVSLIKVNSKNGHLAVAARVTVTNA